ncbi:hypothetical protein ENSA5_68620 [Enhygromyxa salina]|uniref:Uncharacterized protein n=1 Tax=Enhygromyxa salina TaxID=215803 RepID=A0A2S9XB58_9BACT|nr:hypothetical protein ENSA5_68620 [Enhygromyxa salina]
MRRRSACGHARGDPGLNVPARGGPGRGQGRRHDVSIASHIGLEVDRRVAVAGPLGQHAQGSARAPDAYLGVGLEQPIHDIDDLLRKLVGLREGGHGPVHDLREQLEIVPLVAKAPTLEHLVEDRPDREEIHRGLAGLALNLLGRHVAQLALDVDARRLFGREARDPEVHQLDLARDREHHVLGRDVAVDDRGRLVGSEVVGVIEGAQDLADDVGRNMQRQPLAALPQHRVELREVDAVDPLHGHEALALALARVEHLHDRRVVEQRRQPRLVEEHLAILGLLAGHRVEHLERHGLANVADDRALRHPDLGHAAGADLAMERIRAQLFVLFDHFVVGGEFAAHVGFWTRRACRRSRGRDGIVRGVGAFCERRRGFSD